MNTKDWDFIRLVFSLTSELREVARHFKSLGNRDVYDSIMCLLNSFRDDLDDLLKYQ